MYERFTDSARKAMQLANRAAQEWCHEYVGQEHLLLGLIATENSRGAEILKSLGVKLCDVEKAVRARMVRGPEMVTMGKLPQTPRAKKVIEYAMEGAKNLGHNYVGTEHLTLGVLRDTNGVSRAGTTLPLSITGIVLREMGVTEESFLAAMKKMLGSGRFLFNESDSKVLDAATEKVIGAGLPPSSTTGKALWASTVLAEDISLFGPQVQSRSAIQPRQQDQATVALAIIREYAPRMLVTVAVQDDLHDAEKRLYLAAMKCLMEALEERQ